MPENIIEISYRFTSDDTALDFAVHLDSRTLEYIFPQRETTPDWTRVEAGRCAGCPLDPETRVRCPLALAMVDLVEHCGLVLSYAEVEATVVTPERTVTRRTSAQKAISSLLGLVMATSGCPHLNFLKPLARFHLPFATREETLFRSASAYLLAQYFLRLRGESSDLDLTGLRTAYARLQAINAGMVERLRHVSSGDANVNALVLLDLFAQDIPFAIDERLHDIEYLFLPYLQDLR